MVQDKYSDYDSSGNPSGTVVDKSDSLFYGNVTIYGSTNLIGGIMNTISGIQGPISPQGVQGPPGVAGFSTNRIYR